MKRIVATLKGNVVPIAGVVAGAAAFAAASAVKRLSGARRVRGKTALVCGASRGLGRMIALELARKGARVAITARSSQDLESVRTEILREGGSVFAAACDLRELAQVTELVSDVRRSFGEIDMMVAVASTIEVGPIEAMNAGDFEEAMCSIFDTALHPTLAVLPEMRARKKGSLTYIASIGGKIAVPHLAPYTSAKFAVVGLAESLRAELSKDGIGVLTVVPGLMRTGSYVHAHFKGAAEDEYAWFGATSTSPVTAMSAERAARRIVRSIERGDDELVLTATAKLATRAKGIVPSFVSFLMSIAARLLPQMPSDPVAKARLREGADIERTSTSTKVAAVRAQGLPLQLANHQT